MIRPASGAQRAIGSERSRSKTPLVRSVLRPDAGVHRHEERVHDDDAGQREVRYAPVEPAIAPPNT